MMKLLMTIAGVVLLGTHLLVAQGTLSIDELSPTKTIFVEGFQLHTYKAIPADRKELEFIYFFDKKSQSFRKFSEEYRGLIPRHSPKGKYISFFGTRNPSESVLTNGLNKNLKFHLFSGTGKYVRSFDIQPSSYEWSPDEEYVVYASTGSHKEAALSLAAVWVLNVSNGARKKIFDRAMNFRWADFDSSIYLFDGKKVFRYDPSLQTYRPTKYKDIDFSRSGKYYIKSSGGENPLKIYIRETNADITEIVRLTMMKYMDVALSNGEWYPPYTVKWGNEQRLILMDEKKKSFIYDIDLNAVVDSFDGYVVGFLGGTQDTAIVIIDKETKMRRIDSH